MRGLMEKAGQLGLFGVSIPSEYGGLEMDFTTALRVTEGVGGGHSFPVAFAAHTGIGMLPILYFGTDAQKQKYLPGLTDGEWMGAYCLTEPGSGSDALGAKTRAGLNAEGTHYVLNGQKMWITNAGFADVFIVFAQVDGDKFTGFIVEQGHARPDPRQRGAQDGHQGQHHPAGVLSTMCRCPTRTCWARLARATSLPSTSSTSAASSWRRRAWAPPKWRADAEREVCQRARAVQAADLEVWRHSLQAGAAGHAHLRRRRRPSTAPGWTSTAWSSSSWPRARADERGPAGRGPRVRRGVRHPESGWLGSARLRGG